jgi:hypothetical protein
MHKLEIAKDDELPTGNEAIGLLWASLRRHQEPDVSKYEAKKLRLIIQGAKKLHSPGGGLSIAAASDNTHSRKRNRISLVSHILPKRHVNKKVRNKALVFHTVNHIGSAIRQIPCLNCLFLV